MNIGIIYPQTELGGDPEGVRRIGLAAEELGFGHLLAYDHVLGSPHDREPRPAGPYTDKHPFHDPLTMFAYLAAITSRIELVTGVIILPQRQTALVARQAADVDLLSHERLRLGVGIGWNHVEYEALGQDFRTRGKRVEEQIALLRAFWAEPLVSFDGRFDHVDRAALNPRPARAIPIWMGGFADVAMARAARIADGFIFADGAGDAFEMLPRLRQLLGEAGRDPASFPVQCNMLTAKSAVAAAERAARWRDQGGSHAAVSTMGRGHVCIEAHLDYIGEVAAVLGREGML